MLSLQIKQQFRQILGRFQLAGPAEFLWRSLTPKGRLINKRMLEHRERMQTMYSQFVKAGDLCFDVGANLGTRTEVFLALGAKVISVEPQQKCVDYLKAKYRGNKRVTIEPVGLDEAPGQREFHISTHSALSSMSPEWMDDFAKRGGKFASHSWVKTVTVNVDTLDNVIKRHGMPVFCKIDVEGFEYQVLKGLSKSIRAISLEYTPEHIQPAQDCVKRLATLGNYEFNYSIDETMSFALPQWVSAETMTSTLVQLRIENITGDIYARLR